MKTTFMKGTANQITIFLSFTWSFLKDGTIKKYSKIWRQTTFMLVFGLIQLEVGLEFVQRFPFYINMHSLSGRIRQLVINRLILYIIDRKTDIRLIDMIFIWVSYTKINRLITIIVVLYRRHAVIYVCKCTYRVIQ